MPRPNLRHSARAVILTDDHRVLLCRHEIADPPGQVVWATPGGGVEPDETTVAALRRELREEVGLVIDAEPPHVWRRTVVAPGHLPGYDGVVHDFFLVRTAAFVPDGTLDVAAENITELRWWPVPEIAAYRGPDLFAPRALAALVAALLTDGVPAEPTPIGL